MDADDAKKQGTQNQSPKGKGGNAQSGQVTPLGSTAGQTERRAHETPATPHDMAHLPSATAEIHNATDTTKRR